MLKKLWQHVVAKFKFVAGIIQEKIEAFTVFAKDFMGNSGIMEQPEFFSWAEVKAAPDHTYKETSKAFGYLLLSVFKTTTELVQWIVWYGLAFFLVGYYTVRYTYRLAKAKVRASSN
ncbi:hypothetical protein A7981_05625 [Methylovorus sp. MM2]|uniref:hypothetical protein n=1 Tax=Methylovorus sp. MM2 TaxID=1848038 RepID=UPI0007DE72B0|nr:hypothetical protein [Methylovorus sp. MM2]OAM52916.1 hypothetical protein A7981_05625 [Methylovorus sp. MM2]